MTTITEDGKLILRIREGDLEALGELYDHHHLDIYRTALAITCDHDSAEKVLQECFLRLNRSIHSLQPSHPLKSWLYREVVRLSYACVKRRRRWPLSLDWRHRNPKGPSPRSKTRKKEPQQELINALEGLEFYQRVVIVLYYYNSLVIDDIAGIMGCSLGIVKSRLYYGRENLRRRLSATFATPSEIRGELAVRFQELFLQNTEI